MRIKNVVRVLAFFALVIGCFVTGKAQVQEFDHPQDFTFVPSLVTKSIDDSKFVKLSGNTHPMVTPARDSGRADANKVLQRMVLVLKRSPQQEKALAAFNERQYDSASPDFHHWLTAEEFGRLYGPSDSDMTTVTSWLLTHGFAIDEVSKGRVSIQFSGTIGQVEDAFHVEMHKYLVNGKEHLANDRDPQIPDALSPVLTGVASLNDFFPKHYSHPGQYVKRDLHTGKYSPVSPTPFVSKLSVTNDAISQEPNSVTLTPKGSSNGAQPEFGYVDPNTGYQREELSPYDVATIYNILPLWNESTPINGKGVKVAIVGLSDVQTSDFNTFRGSFGLPAGTLTTLHSGADPGITNSQGENTEDVEMVSATAPGAQVVLVSDVDNATTNGLVTAINYIVENNVAPILTMSYGECELNNGSAGNSLFNQIFQQAATAGISSFVASGDSGSGVCTSQNGTPPYADSYGLQVSGMASTPYVTAVGGTDLQWPFTEAIHAISTYWNSTNDAHGASAKGYMPEMSWNDTCTNPLLLNIYNSYGSSEALCNAAIDGSPGLVEMGAGSGGVSHCTTPSGTAPSTCSGGYAKPTWQTGVTGIPADGKRDLPDVSMFAAYGFQSSTGIPGSALLICQASGSPETSCDYSNPDYIVYQENGGTSAASPLTAGIMALVLQRAGSAQGLANPVLYQLAAKENYSVCNSNTVAAGNTCIFSDTTSGSNAAVCLTGYPNCVTDTAGDQVGLLSGYNATTGYDLTTGLGSFNVTNLVNAWPTTSVATPVFSPIAGTYTSAQSVKITAATAGSTIYYTTNGSTPTTSSTKYTVAIAVSATETLKAIAVAPGYSQSAVATASYTIQVAGTPAVLTSPAAGSTLSTSATFKWTAGTGVTAYQLWLGTIAGASNLYNSHGTLSLSETVTGLPSNGGTIFATLFSQINGVYKSNSYTFIASGTPSPAVLTSPAPGGKFSGTSATFAWTAGTGVTAYQLWLGSTPGANNIFNSGGTANLSVAVTGLPSNGGTIFATLFSLIDGAYKGNSYTYIAVGTPALAVLSTPAPGSKLTGSSATFTWTTGTGVTNYQLWLGTTAGSNNLYNSSGTYNHSATVTGLPVNGGTIFATLFSLIDGVYKSNAYTYIASGTPAAAVLTTPTPGSKLAGSSATFAWTTGTGVTAYQLWIGTTAGASDLYNSHGTAALSAAVAGLPSNGKTIYVTLFSLIDGAYKSNAYTYTATGQ